MILLFTTLFWLLNASYEGFYDRGKDMTEPHRMTYLKISSVIKSIFLAGVGITALFYFSGWQFLWYKMIPIWKVILGFGFIGFMIKDVIWNLARGVKWNYYGTTKIYDRVMAELGSWGWFIKVCFGIVGIVFLLGIE